MERPQLPEGVHDTEYQIVTAKCWSFVRDMHIYQYPHKHTDIWSYSRWGIKAFDMPRGEWYDWLSDRMPFETDKPLEERVSWIIFKTNYVLERLEKWFGMDDVMSWRRFIIDNAGSQEEGLREPDYRDGSGQPISYEALMPTESEWPKLFSTSRKPRMTPKRLARWLEPNMYQGEWPSLPDKPEHPLILPGFPEYNPFQAIGGIVISATQGETTKPSEN